MNKGIKLNSAGIDIGDERPGLVINRENCIYYPKYKKLFESYTNIKEIHTHSCHVHGYFGSSFNTYVEIDGCRVNSKKFNYYIHYDELWSETKQELERINYETLGIAS